MALLRNLRKHPIKKLSWHVIEKMNGLRRYRVTNQHTGSSFDDFLEDEGILEEVSAKAHKRLLALQLGDIMEEKNITKISLAEKLKTSRSQLDRILDPENSSITLEVLERVAHAVGKKLHISFS